MSREKEGYREARERLDEAFPGREVISQKELAEFLGRTPLFVRQHWKPYWNKNLCGYSKTKIASVISQ